MKTAASILIAILLTSCDQPIQPTQATRNANLPVTTGAPPSEAAFDLLSGEVVGELHLTVVRHKATNVSYLIVHKSDHRTATLSVTKLAQ